MIEVLPAGNFKISLENGHQVLAHLGGKLRKNRIRVVLGDKVTVALTPYDPTRGFYSRMGYRQAASIPHFYAPEDDKVVYVKHLGRT